MKITTVKRLSNMKILKSIRRMLLRLLGVEEGATCLTKRQNEILNLVAKGYSNVEIQGLLHLSSSTVKNHMSDIFIKLGAKNRSHAVIIAAKKGIISLKE